MRILFIALLFLLPFTIIAQNLSGYYKSTYSLQGDGKTKKKEPVGKWTYYFNNGQKAQSGFYDKDGYRIGSWEFYWDNGQLAMRGNYHNDDPIGKWEAYSKEGIVQFKGSYNGNGYKDKQGAWVEYYTDGQKREEGAYDSLGRKVGRWKEYYRDGSIEYDINYASSYNSRYSDSHYSGSYKLFYEGGQLQREIIYNSKGEKQGAYKSFYSNGKPHEVGMYVKTNKYVHNRKGGNWTVYYNTGKVKLKGLYDIDGELNGIWYKNYSNGQKYQALEYKHGKLMNVLYCYNSQGVRIDAGTLKDGNGTLKDYASDGTENYNREFVDGEIKKEEGDWYYRHDFLFKWKEGSDAGKTWSEMMED